MKFSKMLLVFLAASCTFGLDVKPDSMSLTLNLMQNYHNALDTIILYNPSDKQIQIDTVTIKFLNGNPLDFSMGKACDPTDSLHSRCYIYSGWFYGLSMSLGYVRDSLFVLQNKGVVQYTIQPRDSVQFSICAIINCPYCGRRPSFPATTKFLYSFNIRNGERASFLLKLNHPTIVVPVQNPYRCLMAGHSGESFNLRGQKMDREQIIGILVRNNKLHFILDWDSRNILNNK